MSQQSEAIYLATNDDIHHQPSVEIIQITFTASTLPFFFFLRYISTVSPIYAFITLAPAYYTYNLGFKYLNTYRLEALQIFLWTYVFFTEANGPWKWLNE